MENYKKSVSEIMNKEYKESKYAQLTIDTIRVLSCEMVSEAKSGHPGIALGAAPIMYTLFKEHLNIDPKSSFLNRDRFILSAGHGSALLYATMHLAGYDEISINELKNFRKINSKTAGHPESRLVDGIDASTGPLGQGIGVAVGMAIAETKLREYYKKTKLFDFHTYCLFGDGCFQEGVSYEAFSIAAKYKLNKLIFIYDSNDIQLEGKVSDSTITDTKKYFESLGFNYIKVNNGNEISKINNAINLAKMSIDKPTIIEVKTKIGYGSVNECSPKAHGTPLNDEQMKLLKEKLSYHNEKFEISKNAYAEFENCQKRGEKHRKIFEEKIEKLKESSPEKYDVFQSILDKKFTFDTKEAIKQYSKNVDSTRNISFDVMKTVCKNIPLISLISPDISSSTKISYPEGGVYSPENRLGTNLNLGVREFAMGTVLSGISSTGLKAIGSTFLPFSDYCKPAIRLSAISKNPSIFVFSHDSIAVGEDGPTHQAIEQLWGLRLIPNHVLLRPCNYEETIKSFELALENPETTFSIVTSRQEFELPNANNVKVNRGAYLIKTEKSHDISILATGAEVSVAIEVSKILNQKNNIRSNIISMPSFELFMKQIDSYKKTIFDGKPIISIEFGVTYPWGKIADFSVGINKYGYSGAYNEILKKTKLTPDDIAEKILKFLDERK